MSPPVGIVSKIKIMASRIYKTAHISMFILANKPYIFNI